MSKKSMKIKELFSGQATQIEGEVTVRGWIRNHRKQKNMGFIELYDGSCFKSLQLVYTAEQDADGKLKGLRNGACIEVTGIVQPGFQKELIELNVKDVLLLGDCTEDYPLQPKRHSIEFLRENAYLRPRTRLFQAVFRVRSVAAQAIHTYFTERGFLYVNTPLITANDAEGAGNTFTVTTLDIADVKSGDKKTFEEICKDDFFGRHASLAVTGQLEAEVFAMAFGDVYTFGPTFRAEHSNTKTHAAEFWMIEPEMAFADLNDNMALAESMLKYVIRYVLEHAPEEMNFFNQFIDKGLLDRLNHVLNSEFGHVTYTEAVKLLEEHNDEFDYKVFWGCDLQTEHERYLTEKIFKRPVFVTDYPKEIKAFYMKMNEDGKTVAAMDCLVPGIGEIIGGSQREDDYDKLVGRMEELGLKKEDYGFYLDLRKYGSVRHSGFGLGFERCVMYLTGMGNIRDVIPFPRTVNNCEL